MENLKVKKRERDGTPEVEADSPETKRLRKSILDYLDDEAAESTSAEEELNSFMKSFQDEFKSAKVADITSDCGDSQTDIGYLLEATDDELGLPPTAAESPIGSDFHRGYERIRVETNASEIGGEFWEAPYYEDSFGFGFEAAADNTEYLALDGLFDYSNMNFGSGDPFSKSPASNNS